MERDDNHELIFQFVNLDIQGYRFFPGAESLVQTYVFSVYIEFLVFKSRMTVVQRLAEVV